MVIFKYELKNHRKYILSWTITLAICIFIMIPIYYSLLGSAESSSNPLYDTLGKTDFFQSTGVSICLLYTSSPVPIGFEKIDSGANGYFSLVDKRIAIQEGESQLQTLKTAIHEIAHARLHDVDLNAPKEEQNRVDRRTREVEAESVAYTVCQHLDVYKRQP